MLYALSLQSSQRVTQRYHDCLLKAVFFSRHDQPGPTSRTHTHATSPQTAPGPPLQPPALPGPPARLPLLKARRPARHPARHPAFARPGSGRRARREESITRGRARGHHVSDTMAAAATANRGNADSPCTAPSPSPSPPPRTLRRRKAGAGSPRRRRRCRAAPRGS